jgi:anti-sigma regulatory factor (Ser/Thr protein kinase)
MDGAAVLPRTEMFDHRALLYSSADEFLDAVVPFVRAGVRAGDRVLAVSTGENVRALAGALGAAGRIDSRDSHEWYATPGRTLRAYKRYVDRHNGSGRGVTIVGEPVWAGRSAAAVREWARYESLINVAFAGAATRILCPYDARVVPEPIMEHAECSHPTLAAGIGSRPSGRFLEPAAFFEQLDRQPLEPADATIAALDVTGDLTRVRRFVRRNVERAGLRGDRVADLALAVHELATNALRHGSTPVELRMWTAPAGVVAEVADGGAGLDDRFAGHLEPGPAAVGGRGLWMARQLCDVVEVRSTDAGTVVRVHMSGQ